MEMSDYYIRVYHHLSRTRYQIRGGNTLFDKWIKANKIPRNKVTPLYKLMFIGTRGMGALEEPLIIFPSQLIPKDILRSQRLSMEHVTENSFDRIWKSIPT